MNVSSISEAMQPTLRGRLKRVCNQISFLETPTREVGLKNPYLICDYCGGSHEADECEQNNPSEHVCLSGGDIYNDPSLLRFYQNDDTSPWGNNKHKEKGEDGPEWIVRSKFEDELANFMLEKKSHAKRIGDMLVQHRKELHEQYSQILSTINNSETPEPEAPTFAITTITTRSGISTQDLPFPTPHIQELDIFTEGEPKKEGPEGTEPSIMQEPTPRPSILYQPSKTSSLPFPSRLNKQKKDDEDERLLSIFKQIHINLPFLEAMIHMPKGAKVLKDLLSHKEKLEKAVSSVKLSEECSAIIQRNLPQKEGDPGCFTLPCLIGPMAAWNHPDSITRTPTSILLSHQENNQLPVVISSALSTDEKTRLLEVLRNHKGAIAWSIMDIKGIDSSSCTHKILMKDEFKPSVQPQRRVNPNIKEVVKKEVIKLLDAGLIYPISDSPWVFWILSNPYRFWRSRENHVHLPLWDLRVQMNAFGLCNAPATFQRCMTAIFHELIEDIMEVFMDGFSVFGNSFNHCLKNLEKMLKRCKETNLVSNWEKCHFKVKEGIVLGHKVLGSGIEVDKAKIKAISKLPYPTNVKAIRSFLGHAEFDIEIRNKKGAENLAANHLSRLENPDLGKLTRAEIKDLFLEERLMEIIDKNDEPYADRIIRRCVAGEEAAQILRQCHNGPSGGHHGIATTARKVIEAGFYWPHIFCVARKLVQVLLFNSRLRLFPGKLKSRWYRPFSVSRDMKNGAIELYDEEGSEFIVNKQRVKPYQKNILDTNKDDDVTLEDEGEVT
ncbi:reverse transcriptase domain-containing protein [Tanacetum coccineum]